MNQIDMLNELGMVHEDDVNFRRTDKNPSWDKTLEALKKNPNPAAQALYEKLRRKYNL